MKRSFVVVATMAVAVGILPATNGASAPATTSAIGAQLVAGGLDWPSGFTFAPDGRIFYGERFSGEIRIIDLSTGSNTLFGTVTNIVGNGERGLLGVAIHPSYPTVPFAYVYATRFSNGDVYNQIIAMRDDGGIAVSPRIIWSSPTVAGDYHDGGRILFGPDGMLYAVQGEAHGPENAQDPTNNAGKVMRMTARGKVPPDNPFPGSLNFTYGLRNSYGFTFDPFTGLLWETENGPECNDEINIELSGENHGWGPNETCSTPPPPPENTNQDGANPVMPLSFYTPTVAPVGNAFCMGCALGAGEEGNMFYGRYNTRQIQRVVPTLDRMHIASENTAYTHSRSPLSLEVAPDGRIYFSDDTAIWRLIQT